MTDRPSSLSKPNDSEDAHAPAQRLAPEDLLKVEPPVVPPRPSRTWRRIRHILQVVIPLLILWFIWEELSDLDFAKLRVQLAAANPRLLAASALTAVVAILATGLYDVLAFPHTPTQGATRRWGLGAMFFSWTNFVALGPVGVPFLRLHWYGKAGMPASDVIRGVGRLYIGMTAGLVAWGVAALVPLPFDGVLIRCLLAVAVAPLLSAAAYWLRARVRWSDRAPTPMRTMLLLGLVGGLDWGAVLLSFILAARAVGVAEPTVSLMAVFFFGHVVGLASMIPGGLGTADATWLLRLTRAGVPSATAAAHVVLFRLTFYIVPWLLSLLVIGIAIIFHQAGFNGRASGRNGATRGHPRPDPPTTLPPDRSPGTRSDP